MVGRGGYPNRGTHVRRIRPARGWGGETARGPWPSRLAVERPAQIPRERQVLGAEVPRETVSDRRGRSGVAEVAAAHSHKRGGEWRGGGMCRWVCIITTSIVSFVQAVIANMLWDRIGTFGRCYSITAPLVGVKLRGRGVCPEGIKMVLFWGRGPPRWGYHRGLGVKQNPRCTGAAVSGTVGKMPTVYIVIVRSTIGGRS